MSRAENDRPAGARRARSNRDEHGIARKKEYHERCYEEACLARSLGISVLPATEDGNKKPLSEVPPMRCKRPECVAARNAQRRGWKHRQHCKAGLATLQYWYLEECRKTVAYVCGQISGGLLLIEFEASAIEDGTFKDFLDRAENLGLGQLIERIRAGYEDRSPSGGFHWFVYCDDAVTEVLAHGEFVDDQTHKSTFKPLIETRGEGSYAIAAPTSGSAHPSGKRWKRISGGLETIIHLTADELDSVLSLARQFDEKPPVEFKPPRGSSSTANGRPGDVFNELSTWAEVLEPHEWKYLFTASDREHWCRSGKEPKGTSATISPDGQRLHVFSTSTPFEAGRSYGKFAAYAVLNHADEQGRIDWKRAAETLRREGYGATVHSLKGREAILTSMADIQEESVEWLWLDRIPYGNQTIIAGNPGQGKSVLSIDLIARATTGRRMPLTLGRSKPIKVILLTAEDSASNTIKPRLKAARADLDKVFVLEGIREQDGKTIQLMTVPDDTPLLRERVIEIGARLLIIDPLDAFLADHVNSHQNQSIRRALTPLKMMAEETGVAVVAICHLNKNAGARENALYRINGSIGNAAAARSVLLVAPDPEDEDSRILAPVKANLSVLAPSLAFHLEQSNASGAVSVKWDGFSELGKDDLLTQPRSEARNEAKRFLRSVLREGPVRVQSIQSEAAENGISERTLRRAAKEIGVVKTHVDPPHGYWAWSLPSDEAVESSDEDSD